MRLDSDGEMDTASLMLRKKRVSLESEILMREMVRATSGEISQLPSKAAAYAYVCICMPTAKTPTYKIVLQLNIHRSHSIAGNFACHILRNVNYLKCKKWASIYANEEHKFFFAYRDRGVARLRVEDHQNS